MRNFPTAEAGSLLADIYKESVAVSVGGLFLSGSLGIVRPSHPVCCKDTHSEWRITLAAWRRRSQPIQEAFVLRMKCKQFVLGG
jgi:hypothetical protein